MTDTTSGSLSKVIIEEAISVAKNTNVPNWKDRITQMEKRVQRLDEQMKARPSVPAQLQDSFRKEIDELSLENMQLVSRLEQTARALDRAKQAYKSELHHTRSLKDRLDELEQRLIGALRN